jgi:signal transduction histidine kinase
VAAATTEEDGRPTLLVSVADTGVGIAPEDQARVFEQFGQAGDRLPDGPVGTGLGLPICREIVEQHGGRLWLESAVGAGSRFSFTLPVSTTADAAGGGADEPLMASSPTG